MNMPVAGIDYIGITTPFYCTDKGKFLLHRRSTKCRDEVGVWDAGGGKLEFGQTLEESVLREVHEEYGCEGVILEKLPPYTLLREHNGMKTHWVAIPYLIRVDSAHVTNNDPEKIDEIGWFDLDSLPSPLHTGMRHALKTYRILFEKYASR